MIYICMIVWAYICMYDQIYRCIWIHSRNCVDRLPRIHTLHAQMRVNIYSIHHTYLHAYTTRANAYEHILCGYTCMRTYITRTCMHNTYIYHAYLCLYMRIYIQRSRERYTHRRELIDGDGTFILCRTHNPVLCAHWIPYAAGEQEMRMRVSRLMRIWSSTVMTPLSTHCFNMNLNVCNQMSTSSSVSKTYSSLMLASTPLCAYGDRARRKIKACWLIMDCKQQGSRWGQRWWICTHAEMRDIHACMQRWGTCMHAERRNTMTDMYACICARMHACTHICMHTCDNKECGIAHVITYYSIPYGTYYKRMLCIFWFNTPAVAYITSYVTIHGLA